MSELTGGFHVLLMSCLLDKPLQTLYLEPLYFDSGILSLSQNGLEAPVLDVKLSISEGSLNYESQTKGKQEPKTFKFSIMYEGSLICTLSY